MNYILMPRRAFLTTVAVGAGVGLGARSARATDGGDTFTFEVVRSDAEWRDQLTDLEFAILREGRTEKPKSSPLWDEVREGSYCCRGCELKLYDGYWKTVLDIGWVFFHHSEPVSVVTAIDKKSYEELLSGNAETTMAPGLTEQEIRELDTMAGVEMKCRRCGSHLGHIISYENEVLHCINGTALDFLPTGA